MRFLGTIILLLGLCSCGKEQLLPADYVAWVQDEDNGLRVGKTVDSYDFTLQYRPLEYIVAMENKGNAGIHHDSVQKRIKELEVLQYYTLKIASREGKEVIATGISSEAEYYARMEYFTSGIENDLVLVQGKDTLPCRLFHFERNYQLAPYNNIVVAFDSSSVKADRTFIYDDQVLGIGPVQLTLKASAIENTPQLKVN